MKIYKTLLFVLAVLVLLGCLCFFFPKDGVKIGNFTLRFPTLEKIFHPTVNETEMATVATMEEEIANKEKEIMASKADSVAKVAQLQKLYSEVMTNNISRIYCPGDDFGYFNAFYENARKAEADGRTIRVLHYGDSQIELDRFSSTLRTYFQGLFGGGGPGLLPVVQNVPSSTVHQSASENYTLYSSFGIGNRDKNGRYGIMGKYYRLNGSGTCYISNIHNPSTDHVRLLLYNRSGSFTATLSCTDFSKSITDTVAGFRILEWELPSPTNKISLKFSGSADLHGVMVDQGHGIAVDNIPMRGCSGNMFSTFDRDLTVQSYRNTDVGMIILQYGGNAMPGFKTQSGIDSYLASITQQIRYFKAIYPNTPILFIGPSDMSTRVNGELQSYPLMEYMVEGIKKTALENGAAFWNIYEVMGGHNSMITWVRKGLAGSDYVHFTPKGASEMSKYLQEAFETSYKYFRLSKGEISMDEANAGPSDAATVNP